MDRQDLEQQRRELFLPSTLIELIESGRWVHPSDQVMLSKIPFIRDPLVFLGSKENMIFESGPLMSPDEAENKMFSEYRGSVFDKRDLPWIDVEKTLFIICNKWPGDDVGIALDYRTGNESPRVVGGDWHSGEGCIYREISPSFDRFVEYLGL